MDCQICLESFPELYKVNCDSPVDHLICFECERKWREQMPIRNGKRKMSCPTCRQQETGRTMESLERELASLYVSLQAPIRQASDSLVDAVQLILRLGPSDRSYVAHHILSTVDSTAAEAGAARVGGVARAAAVHRAAAGAGGAAAGAAAAAVGRSSTRPPSRVFCESGRDCRTVSRIHSRTKTHLKCRQCNLVACCANCRRCTGCVPL